MKVEIYGADWCSACKNAVNLCEKNNIDYEYIDIDNTLNLRKLEEKIGEQVRHVPQIFIDGQHFPQGLGELTKRVN